MSEKKLSIREQLEDCFDIARQEGMLHSKDGKHSQSSESDADSILTLFKEYVKGCELAPEEMKGVIFANLHLFNNEEKAPDLLFIISHATISNIMEGLE
jgi:hypothetical protein